MLQRQAEVPLEHTGARFDQVAAALWPEFSRAQITRWIRGGELTLDGAQAAPKQKVRSGQRLELEALAAPQTAAWQTPQPVDFRIVYEDEHLLVIDKPAGVVVHPGAGNPDGTLVNGLLNYRASLREMPRAGIVHRLDKDTSGLLLVAASLPAHTHLVRALAERQIKREYLAYAEGNRLRDGAIDAPIGRDPRVRTRQRVSASGREARTYVRVLARYRAHCKIAATLETGRTHQIRVHLSSQRHPLVGDQRYGWRRLVPNGMAPAAADLLRGFARQALHAAQLTFDHPASSESLAFTAPLPADLQALEAALETDSREHAQDE